MPVASCTTCLHLFDFATDAAADDPLRECPRCAKLSSVRRRDEQIAIAYSLDEAQELFLTTRSAVVRCLDRRTDRMAICETFLEARQFFGFAR